MSGKDKNPDLKVPDPKNEDLMQSSTNEVNDRRKKTEEQKEAEKKRKDLDIVVKKGTDSQEKRGKGPNFF